MRPFDPALDTTLKFIVFTALGAGMLALGIILGSIAARWSSF
jgi:hypothetical protein